jgi:hypothetical protein
MGEGRDYKVIELKKVKMKKKFKGFFDFITRLKGYLKKKKKSHQIAKKYSNKNIKH